MVAPHRHRPPLYSRAVPRARPRKNPCRDQWVRHMSVGWQEGCILSKAAHSCVEEAMQNKEPMPTRKTLICARLATALSEHNRRLDDVYENRRLRARVPVGHTRRDSPSDSRRTPSGVSASAVPRTMKVRSGRDRARFRERIITWPTVAGGRSRPRLWAEFFLTYASRGRGTFRAL